MSFNEARPRRRLEDPTVLGQVLKLLGVGFSQEEVAAATGWSPSRFSELLAELRGMLAQMPRPAREEWFKHNETTQMGTFRPLLRFVEGEGSWDLVHELLDRERGRG